MLHQAQGFVFKKNDVNDSDRTFSLFTYELGRVEIFAKSIRKIDSKLRSGIDLLCFSEIEFFQGKRRTLTDAKIVKKYNGYLSDIQRLTILSQITGLINREVKEGQKDEKLFALLFEVFEKMENPALSQKEKNILFSYFFFHFLLIEGKLPEITACVMCKNELHPESIYFSGKDDGVVCATCGVNNKDAKKINSDIIKIVKLIVNKDWNILSKLKFGADTKLLLEEFIKEILVWRA